MKTQIRLGTFETNSSSTHSLIMCSDKEFKLFQAGELVLDVWNDELVPLEAAETDEDDEIDTDRYRTYENYDQDYESFVGDYVTEKGDKVVAFGWYGYD